MNISEIASQNIILFDYFIFLKSIKMDYYKRMSNLRRLSLY